MGSQHPGRLTRTPEWRQALPVGAHSQQEGAFGTEDTWSRRGGRGTLCDLGPCAPSHPDSRYRNTGSPLLCSTLTEVPPLHENEF